MRRAVCHAPACRCVSPCDSYYGDDEEDTCPGWRTCRGCGECEQEIHSFRVRRARRARRAIGGHTIAAGEDYILLEAVEFYVGGPTRRRWRKSYKFSPAGLARWEAAGRPRLYLGDGYTVFYTYALH